MKTETYVRKPFAVQAIRVTDENMRQVAEWFKGKVYDDRSNPSQPPRPYIKIHVEGKRNERQGQAYIGDWVTQTKTGVKVYTNAAFERTFDKAEGVQLFSDGNPEPVGFIDSPGLLIETSDGLLPLNDVPQVNLKTI